MSFLLAFSVLVVCLKQHKDQTASTNPLESLCQRPLPCFVWSEVQSLAPLTRVPNFARDGDKLLGECFRGECFHVNQYVVLIGSPKDKKHSRVVVAVTTLFHCDLGASSCFAHRKWRNGQLKRNAFISCCKNLHHIAQKLYN